MNHTKVVGSTGRLGARYGKGIREDLIEFEKKYKDKRLKCPYCNYNSVKRIAFGIWYCNHCGKKFTGKAYSVK